jgi:hypothetical protein
MPPTPDQQHAADQAAEYGAYVATEPIDIGTARAFNVGDPVPASHVERGVVPADAVAKVTTKAAKAAVEQSPTTTIKES